jgi:DNA-dependent RNA polymerase auxiliary subunit epsilon
MYMATSEQFQAWSERGLPGLIREYTSSLWLYHSKEGCNVTQLIPTRSYHDFFIHHLSDKYVSLSKPWRNIAVSTIGSMLRNSTNSTKSDAAGQSNGLIKMIDERVSS